MSKPKTDPMIRFKKKFKQQRNGCWKWTASHYKNGYGMFYFEGRLTGAHRAAWVLFRGPIPKGNLVCHTCDMTDCVNPDHLFVGTQFDNMQDCARKGRNGSQTHPEARPRGDDHWTHKHPEKMASGNDHWTRKDPERIASQPHDEHGRFKKGVRY